MVVALSLRCCAVLALLFSLPALAQTEGRAAEIQIKAAFLYKFGGFVEWPPKAFAEPDAPFIIGVLGADILAGELEQLVSGRTVHDRRVAVRRLRRSDSLAGLHVLFVGQSEDARLPEILQAARGQAVLLVTESEGALAQGSMINFVTVADKVRFDVALPPAERGQLKISSRLLGVARRVISG
jgi:hypothetical protein